MKVKQSAYERLRVVHSWRNQCNLSGEVLDEYTHEMTLNVLVGWSIDENVDVTIVRHPVLKQNWTRFLSLRIILAHQ